jgi:hypothetical protein
MWGGRPIGHLKLLFEQLTFEYRTVGEDGRSGVDSSCVRLRVPLDLFPRIKSLWISATTNTIQVQQANK